MRDFKEWAVFPGILSIALTLLMAGGVWGADNSLCMGCHQDEALTRQNAQGAKILLYVSEAEFKKSVHGGLSCTDCHARIKDEAHAAGGQKVRDRVECGTCHQNEAKEYRQSLHAKAIVKGTDAAAHCYDCHGKHAIYPVKNEKSMVHGANIEKTCNRCHSDTRFVKDHALGTGPTPGKLFEESIHAQTGGVTCVSCHGSHNLRSLIDPQSSIFRSNVPQTCGVCHPEIAKEFEESIHGVLAAKGRSESPTCTTCHGIHGIKAKIDPDSPVNERRIALTTCPQCHAEERISEVYGITTGLVKSYYDSFHGLSYRGGDTYSANCASCHGVHDIRPSSDPKSMIYKDNLQKTCGKCHPGASANFAKGKMHTAASIYAKEFGDKVVGWVRVVYILLITLVIGGMVFLNFTDWLRKTIDKRPR